MTFTATIVTDPSASAFSQWDQISKALRRLAQDAAYAGIYDTSAARLTDEPVTDFDGTVLAVVRVE